MRLLAGAALLGAAALARADSLEAVGVLGNSGGEGAGLIRVKGDAPSGAFVDREMRVWVNGGDAILRTTLDGRLLERHPLGPDCAAVKIPVFAGVGDALFFIGTLAKGDASSMNALFRLPLAGGPAEPVYVIRDVPPFETTTIAPQPLEGKILLGKPLYRDGKGYGAAVVLVDPATGEEAREFWRMEGGHAVVSGLAVDAEAGAVYVGGAFGKFIAANFTHTAYTEILKLDLSGKETLRHDTFDMVAIPSQFTGRICLAGDGLWEAAGYGFVGRYNRNLQPDPGRVMGWNWDILYGTQFVDLRRALGRAGESDNGPEDREPLLMATGRHGHVVWGTWDRTRLKLEWNRRIGSVPEVTGVAIGKEGWVGVGEPGQQWWWKWDDAANAAPRFGAGQGLASGAGFFPPTRLAGMTQDHLPDPKTGRRMFRPSVWSQSDDRQVMSTFDPPPFEATTAYAVRMINDHEGEIFALSAAGELWRAPLDLRTGAPAAEGWKKLPVEGASFAAPADIVFLPDGAAAVADKGCVWRLEPSGEGFKAAGRFERRGPGEGELFGPALRIAAASGRVVVSDRDLDCVALLDAGTGKCLSVCGTPGKAGDALGAFDAPGAVSAEGDRIVVADTGNQRVVKLLLFH